VSCGRALSPSEPTLVAVTKPGHGHGLRHRLSYRLDGVFMVGISPRDN
jgi:hypothetical protein